MKKSTRSHPLVQKGDKIQPLKTLAETAQKLKTAGETIVLCHGVFDLLHPGHIRHLAEARKQGSILVVTVTADRYVNKGPGRPVFNQNLRAESLAALSVVDYVAINNSPTAVTAISTLKPDVYVKGKEYARAEDDVTGKITDESAAVELFGGRIFFTDDITFSSSKIINNEFHLFPPGTEMWLRAYRQKYSGGDILRHLDAIADLSVLVVGEAIIDEYAFCSGLGKVSKDPILAFLYGSEEAYAGGSLAVANHLAGFCGKVSVISLFGEKDNRGETARRLLHPDVELMGVVQKGAPTIRKRRFVDAHTNAKIFELYFMDDSPLAAESESALAEQIEQRISDFDVVIVADYGHGMITPRIVGLLTARSKFLVVNTQANAGNRGLNNVSRYPRADYVCIDGRELELDTRMRHASHREMLIDLAGRVRCRRFTVTQGPRGSLHWNGNDEFFEAPALATKIVDRVGSGDAVLALTGALVARAVPWEVVAFLTNVAGAEMVGDLGNRISISKANLSKHVISLLK